MTERPTLSPFEQHLAAELERYVAGASDPRPAAEIAADAMRPAGPLSRSRRASGSRRLWLVGLAAVMLLPAAAVGALVLQQPTPDTIVTSPSTDLAILVRRDEGPEPGVAVFAVRPDGRERLLRHVPDSILPGSTLGDRGTVSPSGWLALTAWRDGGPWPMVLVDLGDPGSMPWIVDEASLGRIGAAWSPTGLVAAQAADGPNVFDLVVVDPEAHTTRHFSMRGTLIGGGPSIVWTADGTGFAAYASDRGYQTVPLDGGEPAAGVGAVHGRGIWGTGLATLVVAEGGRVELVAADGSAETIWRPDGGDRALDAAFASDGDGYWLVTDRAQGRQVVLRRLHDAGEDDVAVINRDAAWQDVGFSAAAPDRSSVALSINTAGSPAAVIVPQGGQPRTVNSGALAGFVDGTVVADADSGFELPTGTLPAEGHAYLLPSFDELIAAELALNPGRTVLGTASRDGVPGDGAVRSYDVVRDRPGAGEIYLDCIGPRSVTIRSGPNSNTSSCLSAGSVGLAIDTGNPAIVEASGDTTWRAVIYSP